LGCAMNAKVHPVGVMSGCFTNQSAEVLPLPKFEAHTCTGPWKMPPVSTNVNGVAEVASIVSRMTLQSWLFGALNDT